MKACPSVASESNQITTMELHILYSNGIPCFCSSKLLCSGQDPQKVVLITNFHETQLPFFPY